MKSVGFKAIAKRLAVSHAHCWPLQWGVDVEVFGTKVRPGQLVHADKHGFIIVPADGQKRLLEAARFMDDNECDTVIPAGNDSAGRTMEEILSEMSRAGTRFGQNTRRKFGRTGGEWK
jgi:regulator of RNase E activity RraA